MHIIIVLAQTRVKRNTKAREHGRFSTTYKVGRAFLQTASVLHIIVKIVRFFISVLIYLPFYKILRSLLFGEHDD